MTDGRTQIAFFDVDETVVTVKSMIHFFHYYVATLDCSGDERRRLADDLAVALAPGVPRAVANRRFYRFFAGRSAAEVAARGRAWFAENHAAGGLFHEHTLRELRRHRERGALVALVSGSFRPCLDPIAEHLGAQVTLCTELEIVDGRYSGEVVRPMIGPAKADAARTLIDDTGADPALCFAYGDHPSDLPLLELVGNPVVVGDDAELAAYGRERGWRRIRPPAAVRG